ncbi:hypothetical protein [uncultured Acidaminococcus sp.]|uniref:hypothetical protein n=1 Tax=uncultured Acidaminococcus sp. TaxID=352152 RepID=UPI002621EEB5|nr:hypothetical protein [uncultured Acidaminococcus sp.]
MHCKKSFLAFCLLASLGAAVPGFAGVPAGAGTAPAVLGQGNPLPLSSEGKAPQGMPPGGFNPPGQVIQGTAAVDLKANGVYTDQTYTSVGNDENALRVTGAAVNLDQVAIRKTGGASSNTEGGDFYGMNAALLATDGAKVTIKDSTVTSSAKNGNGLFSYGKDTSLDAERVTITTTGDNSGGIQTTGGATTRAWNLNVHTAGNSSAAIRSDRGGGTVQVNGGIYVTEGSGSPAIYSTAAISVQDAVLQAAHSEGAVIEGKNNIRLVNCTLEGSMDAQRTLGGRTFAEENVHGVMIYQSMSGDAEQGTSSFAMEGGKLICHRGDLFYVTNTDCTLDLTGVSLENLDPQGKLLRVEGNSASRGWGKAGSNGGKAKATAVGQKLQGDIVVDTISQLDLTLGKGTVFQGAIALKENPSGTATGSNIAVTVEKGATWNLTGDSTVDTLVNHGKINLRGHKLTVLGK